MTDAEAGPQHIVIAGDSHSGSYDGLTYKESRSGLEFVCAAANVHGEARAGTITVDGGKALNPVLIDAMRKTGAWPSDTPSHKQPYFVLQLGGPDSILEAADDLWRDHDFILPEMPDLADRSKACVQYQLVRKWLKDRLDPYRAMFARLEADGVAVSAVLPPPPPHRSSAKLRALVKSYNMDMFVAPFPVRGKIAWMTRCYVAQIAADRGIPFVDTWPSAADGLFLRQSYEFDGVHVSRDCAQNWLALICATLMRKTAS